MDGEVAQTEVPVGDAGELVARFATAARMITCVRRTGSRDM